MKRRIKPSPSEMYEALLTLQMKFGERYSLPMSPYESSSNKLMAPEAVAHALGVTVKTLANWRCLGINGLTFVRVGGRIMYHQNAVDAFILAGMRTSTSDIGGRRSD